MLSVSCRAMFVWCVRESDSSAKSQGPDSDQRESRRGWMLIRGERSIFNNLHVIGFGLVWWRLCCLWHVPFLKRPSVIVVALLLAVRYFSLRRPCTNMHSQLSQQRPLDQEKLTPRHGEYCTINTVPKTPKIRLRQQHSSSSCPRLAMLSGKCRSTQRISSSPLATLPTSGDRRGLT